MGDKRTSAGHSPVGSTAGSEDHVGLCNTTNCLETRHRTLEEPCVGNVADSVFDLEHMARAHELMVFLKDLFFLAFVVL